MTDYGHALAIGATGMLAQATQALAAGSERVLLVARHARAFAEQQEDKAPYTPLDLDWDAPAFRTGVTAALAAERDLQTALLWLHKPEAVLPWLLPLLEKARVVLVLGSVHHAAAEPSLPSNVAVVRLGGKRTPDGGRRWLTHDEIGAGAIAALNDGRSRIVGTLG